jgi:hypothetical protein
VNAEKVEGSLSVVEKLTGTRAMTCPWWSFHDAIVIDTLEVYPFFESGQLEFVCGNDPPAVLVEAVGVYHTAFARARDVQQREKDDSRVNSAQHSAAVREMGSLYRGR